MSLLPASIERYLRALNAPELLCTISWEDWLAVSAPYADTPFASEEVWARFDRNGYQWDMHGTLYRPEREIDSRLAFVFFHGGAGSEKLMDLTPDGRPGLARVAASQGFTVLSLTYPGHYPPGGFWSVPVADRMPLYLIDQELSREEILDRNLKCTFNTILQGAGALSDRHLAGRRVLAFGHSTGGPMAAHLYRFSRRTRVIGLVGFGSGGPDGWRREWREETGAEPYTEIPLDVLSRRSPQTFREANYEDPRDLTPWGGAEEYINLANTFRSQMKTSLCDNQHYAATGILGMYAERTGLPLGEFTDHLRDPDHDWLGTISVLLVVGEQDHGHWVRGARLEDKREMFMGAKYASLTRGAKVVLIPRYGHVGYAELHNENIAYLWLWAVKSGYFPNEA